MLSLLVAKGWRITVLAPEDRYIYYKENFPNLHHRSLNCLKRDSLSPLSNWQTYKELKQVYAELKPDIILHYTSKPNIFGGIAAGRLGIPNIAAITGLGYAFIHPGLLQWFTTKLYAYANTYIDQFLFENEDDLALFQKSVMSKGKGIAVKGCGVDVEHYRASRDIPQLGKVVFTFVGRLLKDKGIEEFLAAAKMCRHEQGPKAEFWIVGEVDKNNPASISYDSLLEWTDSGIVKYLGFHEDVRDIMDSSSCIVLPSYREGMPRTILEALSMSRPVITTNVPGCRETVLEDINGYLVESQSAASLSRAFTKFLQLSYSERVQMGINGRKLAEEVFNAKKIATDILEVIEMSLRK